MKKVSAQEAWNNSKVLRDEETKRILELVKEGYKTVEIAKIIGLPETIVRSVKAQ